MSGLHLNNTDLCKEVAGEDLTHQEGKTMRRRSRERMEDAALEDGSDAATSQGIWQPLARS